MGHLAKRDLLSSQPDQNQKARLNRDTVIENRPVDTVGQGESRME